MFFENYLLSSKGHSSISYRNFQKFDGENFDTLVPEAFFYSLLANFATRIASYIFLLARRFDQRFASQIF